MSDIAIRVENLSKRYHIGGRQEKYRTIRESITDAAAAPLRRIRSVMRGEASIANKGEIWALKDVSFEVKRGEVVGIIGRNGAGKSTLLKLLSRIMEPSGGHAAIYGRVGSLLEVGTGFHPELTGRENIYLNGAILGMSRVDVERKFDEIVYFADVEQFVDTPVKHYSSGMYLRLAFAVAAHLEPEILLVDEVLAVGDVEFQKKCIGKMDAVASEGRTVLFVSHNMATIQALCSRGLLLNQGKVLQDGMMRSCVEEYFYRNEVVEPPNHAPVSSEQLCFLGAPKISGCDRNTIILERDFTVNVAFKCDLKTVSSLQLSIKNYTGEYLVHQQIRLSDLDVVDDVVDRDIHNLKLHFPALYLSPGVYSFSIRATMVTGRDVHKWLTSELLLFEVKSEDEPGIGGRISGRNGAVLAPAVQWQLS
jgi:ABC-type polysaccharide/polyol phosphate transport system ATPase subunit